MSLAGHPNESSESVVQAPSTAPTETAVSPEAQREGAIRQVDQKLATLDERTRHSVQDALIIAAATGKAPDKNAGAALNAVSEASSIWEQIAKAIGEAGTNFSEFLKNLFDFKKDGKETADKVVNAAKKTSKAVIDKTKEWTGEFLDTLWPDAPLFSFPVGYSGAVDVSSLRGPRVHPITGEKGKMHHGVDVPATEGTPIVATTNCVVIKSAFQESVDPKTGKKTGAGHYIKVKLEDGTVATFMHLKKAGPPENSLIKKGQVMGYVGKTGGATGPHIHFEIDTAAGEQDPYPWLAAVLRDEAREEGAQFEDLA